MNQPLTGNDIVDLGIALPQQKTQNDRFMQRVFTKRERERILGDADPEQTLWLHWAAKEAAYKIVCKMLDKRPVFAHSKFEVNLAENGAGHVNWKQIDHGLPFFSRTSDGFVHVIAHTSNCESDAVLFRELHSDEDPGDAKLTEDEIEQAPRAESQRVRIAAKTALIQHFKLNADETIIYRRNTPDAYNPPLLVLSGWQSNVDISLSHHGDWVAWSAVQ